MWHVGHSFGQHHLMWLKSRVDPWTLVGTLKIQIAWADVVQLDRVPVCSKPAEAYELFWFLLGPHYADQNLATSGVKAEETAGDLDLCSLYDIGSSAALQSRSFG
jgi:hypothetical protein